MIKRVIAGALSAALCTSAASGGAFALDLSDVFPAPAVGVTADEPVSTAPVTTTAVATTATTTAVTTTSAAAATTVTTAATTAATSAVTTTVTTSTAPEPISTLELGESITAAVYEDGSVLIKGDGAMNDYKSSPFENLKIKSVLIESGVTSIGNAVFRGCDELAAVGSSELTDGVLALPDSIKSVGSSAFEGCTSIKEIKLGSGAESLGGYAFANCTGITNLTVPDNVKSMERSVFSGCTELTELTLPYAATAESCATAEGEVNPDHSVVDLFYDEHWNWENRSFDASSYKLAKITITGGDKIPQHAFANLSCLTEVDLSSTKITSIDKYAFSGCTSLADVKLPASLKNIGDYAFLDCSAVKEFTLPDGLGTIGLAAFGNCTGISSLTIPDSVTSMERNMLCGCTELTELTLPYAATDAVCADMDGEVMYKQNLTGPLIPTTPSPTSFTTSTGTGRTSQPTSPTTR